MLRALSELPDVVALAADDARPAQGHHLGARARRRVPRLLPRLLRASATTSPELTQARLWLVEAAAIGLAIGLDLLGVQRARSRCDAPRPIAAPRLLPDTRRPVGRDRARLLDRRRATSLELAERVRHAAVRLRRGAPPGPLPRGRRGVRRRRGLRDQGVPVPWPWRASSHEEGMHLDVATGGELHVALAAGVPADRLVLHGNNKSRRRAARRARRPASGASSSTRFDELDRLERARRRRARRAPDGAAARHARASRRTPTSSSQTGQDDSKFGFSLSTGRGRRGGGAGRGVAGGRARRASTATSARRCSWPTPSSRRSRCSPPFVARATALPELVDRRRPRRRLRRGRGGADDHRVGATSVHAARARDAGIDAPGSPPSRAGRSSRPPASRSTRVGTIKEIPGVRTYVAVDGGMSDNPRPVLYGSGYEAFLPARRRRPTAPRSVHGRRASTASRATCWCATPRLPADLAVGDILATPVTGAYGHSMASNYNKVPRPGGRVRARRDGPRRRAPGDRRRPPPPRRPDARGRRGRDRGVSRHPAVSGRW